MRTTLNLPDALASAAKERARRKGRTLTSLIEQALTDLLQPAAGETIVAPLPTRTAGNTAILVDIDDKVAVWDALDTGQTAPAGSR